MKDWTEILIEKMFSKESLLSDDDWEIMDAMLNRHLLKKRLKKGLVIAILLVPVITLSLIISRDSYQSIPESEEKYLIADEPRVLVDKVINEENLSHSSKNTIITLVESPIQRVAHKLEEDLKDDIGQENDIDLKNDIGQENDIDQKNESRMEAFDYEEESHHKKNPVSLIVSASFISSAQELEIQDINKGSEDPGHTITQKSTDYYYGEHQPPMTIGLSVCLPLSEKWSLTSGLDYSFCRSKITLSDGRIVGQKAHYLGIPFHFDFMPVKTQAFSVYIGAGFEAYNCVLAKQEKKRIKDANIYLSGIGLIGLKYEPMQNVGIFLEPQYNIMINSNNPTVHSSITDSRNLFMLRAGVNFCL